MPRKFSVLCNVESRINKHLPDVLGWPLSLAEVPVNGGGAQLQHHNNVAAEMTSLHQHWALGWKSKCPT